MEPKENAVAAKRVEEIIDELHEIFSENGWPIACISIVDHGNEEIKVLGTNQLNMKAQFPMLMVSGDQGRKLVKAATIIDQKDDESIGGALGNMLRALAKGAAKDADKSGSLDASA